MVNVNVSEKTHKTLKKLKEKWDMKTLDGVIRLMFERMVIEKRVEEAEEVYKKGEMERLKTHEEVKEEYEKDTSD